VHLAAKTTAQAAQLGPIAHQLPQLPNLRRGDPRLRQTAQAQQVGQVLGIAQIVLDPAVAPVIPGGVGQVQPGATILDDVGGPVVAIGRLHHHFGISAGLGDLCRQGKWFVVDSSGADHVTISTLSHDDTPAPMQINTDVLSLHKGLPSSIEEQRM